MRRIWRNWRAILVGAGVSLSLVLITWLVYLDGGTASGLIHLYYVPIVAASYFLDDLGGIIVAFAAAILAALLPVRLPEEPSQPVEHMVIRGAVFYFIGIMTARLFAKLRERREEATSLLEVSRLVNSSLRPTEVLRTIAETAVHITAAKACFIRLLGRERNELLPAASYGLSLDFLGGRPLRVSDSGVYREVIAGRGVTILDVRADPRYVLREQAEREGLVSLLAIPLKRGGTVFGILGVYSGTRHQWSRRERRLLQAFAEQASIAIHNARLHDDLRRNYWETVSALARAIEAKDPYTAGHSQRVTDYALQLGRARGFSTEEMESLRFGATLHDIGKIGITDEALAHSGHLDMTDEVMDRMHPLIGMSILQPVEFLAPALGAVRYHHERWDGKGYPEGLAGDAIPLFARMIAIASFYDTRQSGSPGRPGLTPREALDEVRRMAGTAFDPELAELFVRTLTGAQG
jgi:HD-GYP domain-containing protein (c-di-GMP phosphodiesterase class II)